MPQLGESVAEGTIGRWLKQVGDHVEKYEPLVEVITDKVNAEVPSPFAGELTEILVQEGATVPNGAEIAVIAAGDEAKRAAAPAPAPAQAAAAQAPSTAAPAPAPAPAAVAPAPSPAPAAPAAVSAPAASAGPAVSAQATPAMPEYEGRVTPAVRRLAREHEIDLAMVPGTGHGGRVTREDVLAYVERQRTGAVAAPTAPAPAAVAPAPAAAPAYAPAPVAPPAAPAAPAAPAQPPVAPSFAAAPATVGVPAGPDDFIKPMTQMRRGIAAQMTRSLAAPHAHLTIEVDMTGAVALRERVKAEYQAREGIGLSYVAIVTKATVEALRRNPDLNAYWTDEGLLIKRHINIGIAVALDDGLIVPVIRDADLLSINGLNHAISDLADRARTNRLRLEDLQGGTFTVDNTGWFGSIVSQPIVNVPEVAILTMEAIVKRPVVIEAPAGDTIGIRPRMNVCMSWDHRATDGAQVGRFVVDVRRWLESVGPETSIW